MPIFAVSEMTNPSHHEYARSLSYVVVRLANEQIKMYVPNSFEGKHGSNDSASRTQKIVLLC